MLFCSQDASLAGWTLHIAASAPPVCTVARQSCWQCVGRPAACGVCRAGGCCCQPPPTPLPQQMSYKGELENTFDLQNYSHSPSGNSGALPPLCYWPVLTFSLPTSRRMLPFRPEITLHLLYYLLSTLTNVSVLMHLKYWFSITYCIYSFLLNFGIKYLFSLRLSYSYGILSSYLHFSCFFNNKNFQDWRESLAA